MKLTQTGTTWDRSLERRWDLTNAEPVLTHPLHPTVEFVPVDLRVWWQVGDGRWPESLRAHAWPAKDKDRDRTFASWDSVGGRYPAAMPGWVQDLAKVVRTDLDSNRTSSDTGSTADFWAYGLDRRWDVEDAGTVADWRRSPFVPVDLDISWTYYPGRPKREHRYSIYAHSAGRSDRSTAQWGGNPTRHDPDLPAWIRELADAQYADLVAHATRFELERENR